MGQVQIAQSKFVSVKKGLFLIQNPQGDFTIQQKDGTKIVYTSTNGFDGYIDAIKSHSKSKEVVVGKKTVTVHTRYWIVEMHDDDGEKFSLWFDEKSNTFFGLINGLASIKDFGYIRLVSSESNLVSDGKTLYFTHIWVKNLNHGVWTDVPRKFTKNDIPEAEIVYDATGNPKFENGFPVKDYTAKIKFFADLIPGIMERIHASNGGFTEYQLTDAAEEEPEESYLLTDPNKHTIQLPPVETAKKQVESMFPSDDDEDNDSIPF